MSMFSSGVLVPQHKEPALSKKILHFVNPRADRYSFDITPAQEENEIPDAQVIIEIARKANIIDESTGEPLFEQMLKAEGTSATVVVDAIDDEPYVSSKIAPMLQMQEEFLGGAELCKQVCKADEVTVLVYKHITGLESHIPAHIGGYSVVRVRGGYPARPSYAQLKKLGERPIFVVSVGALIHLYRAIKERTVQRTAFVTVSGNCVQNPANIEVSVGMTVSQVIERVGLSQQPDMIILGGPMRGVAVNNTENTMIIPTTRAIIALKRDKKQYHQVCIGCGRCEQVCPTGLNPAYIRKFVEAGCYNMLKDYDANFCIGCGTCSYICPSRINVAGAVQKAKEYVKNHNSEGEVKQNAE